MDAWQVWVSMRRDPEDYSKHVLSKMMLRIVEMKSENDVAERGNYGQPNSAHISVPEQSRARMCPHYLSWVKNRINNCSPWIWPIYTSHILSVLGLSKHHNTHQLGHCSCTSTKTHGEAALGSTRAWKWLQMAWELAHHLVLVRQNTSRTFMSHWCSQERHRKATDTDPSRCDSRWKSAEASATRPAKLLICPWT